MARRIAWIVTLLLVAGCAARSPSPSLWRLEPVAAMPAAWEADAASVYVGPVEVPRYVDRSEIMQRTGPSRLEPEALHRWAEPLDDAILRLIGEELARRLASSRVVTYPEQPRMAVDYQVSVRLARLDGRMGETVDLVARWSLADADSGEVVAFAREDISEPAGDTMEAFVGAHAAALSELAARIAAAIRAMPPGPGGT